MADKQKQINDLKTEIAEKQFEERVLHIDRVARVVKGGRRFRFRALVVVGDKKGRVGVATAKGADVTSAVSKAVDVAKKNMQDITIYNGTFPHEAEESVSGARILLRPAAPGTGLIAGGAVRVVLEIAGVQNALSKSLGSSNKLNIAYATLKALKSMKPASEWVTRQGSSSTTAKKKTESKPATETKKKASK
ncbi:MAG TPA: 30S ribosomal protein S5 [Candidatus Saccharimonadales bacterium]|nr:30S ribosomal protein S5 [Candidatus Saccharimonadales bacterium]